jgi:hypothetical protein
MRFNQSGKAHVVGFWFKTLEVNGRAIGGDTSTINALGSRMIAMSFGVRFA